MDKTKIKTRKCPACGEDLALSDFTPRNGVEVWYCTTEHRNEDGYIDFCPRWGQSELFEPEKIGSCTLKISLQSKN